MSEPLPDARLCVHAACGTATPVTGRAFDALADPFADVRAIYCGGCGGHFPLDQFAWADTGEGVAAARARWAARTPAWARWVAGRYGWLVIIVACAAAGAAVGWAADEPGRLDGDRWRWVGGITGASLGVFLVGRVLYPFIRWRYYGLPTFRLLQ